MVRVDGNGDGRGLIQARGLGKSYVRGGEAVALDPLSARQRRDHVEAALRLVGLAERMQHLPRQLSGGQVEAADREAAAAGVADAP